MTCVLIIALLVGVLMYNHPFSFSGRLILVELILTFRRHLLNVPTTLVLERLYKVYYALLEWTGGR